MATKEVLNALRKIDIIVEWFGESADHEYDINTKKALELIDALEAVH